MKRVSVAVLVCTFLGLTMGSPARAQAATPANDTVAGATTIAALPFSDTMDTTAATTDADDDANTCFYDVGNTVWYRFSPETSSSVDLTTAGSDFTTTIEVFVEETREIVACNEDAVWGDTTRVRFQADEGVTYLVRVAGAWGESGTLVFGGSVYTPPPPPSNDSAATATTITELPYSDTVDTTAATGDADDESSPCFGAGDHSVWYRYTPARDIVLNVATAGSNFDTVLEVVDAADHTTIGCDDDGGSGVDSRLRLELSLGRTYLIRADGYGGDSGQLVLSAEEFIPLAATLTAAETGRLTPGGRALVDFTLTCNKLAAGEVAFGARQALGPVVTGADAHQTVSCGDTATFPVGFTPTSGAFLPGLVEVDWSGYVCSDGYQSGEEESAGGEYWTGDCVDLEGTRNVLLLPGT